MNDYKPGDTVTVYRPSRHGWGSPNGKLSALTGTLSPTGKSVTSKGKYSNQVARLSEGWTLNKREAYEQELADLEAHADRLRRELERVKGAAGNVRGALRKMGGAA